MSQTSAADLAHSLKGAKFPIEKIDLMDVARENDAPEEVMEVLEDMPDGEYGSIADVERAFGEMNREEERDSRSGRHQSGATQQTRKGGHHSHGGRSRE